jgi:biopolymer transport protein ExbD
VQFQRETRQSRDVDVNLTPLIDVVFLLLIFFMVSTSFIKETHLSVNLPRAQDATQASADEDPIEIIINQGGFYQIDGHTLVDNDIGTLRSALKNLSGDNYDRALTITADAAAPYQSVVSLIDVAGNLGFRRVHITTQPDSETSTQGNAL